MLWVIGLAVIVLVLWLLPDRRKPTPVLVVVQDGEEWVEGVVREATRRGHPVYVLDIGSRDETGGLLKVLQKDVAGLHLLEGSLDEALFHCPGPALLMLTLVPGTPIGRVLEVL